MSNYLLMFHIASGVVSFIWIGRLLVSQSRQSKLVTANALLAATTTLSGIGLLLTGASFTRVCIPLGVYVALLSIASVRHAKKASEIRS